MSRPGLKMAILALIIADGLLLKPHAEVSVEDDEVVFVLKAPQARKVFLVGDFNNWNPTVEMMTREGGAFRATLFLVPGDYHYKFVVDGKWISDPDNPAKDPREGSQIMLIERVGMLILGSAAESAKENNKLWPSGRGRGDLNSVNGEVDAKHQIDLFLNVNEKFASAKVDLLTRDDSWSKSPFDKEISFDRGKIELRISGGKITGFENDSIWTSRDPFNLIGKVGIYGFNAGFGRRGISLEEEFLKLRIRALYSDYVGSAITKPLMVDSSTVDSFLSSIRDNGVLYTYDSGYFDEDSFGGEVFLDLKGLKAGYARRENRGMHKGLMITADRIDSTFTAKVSNSIENWKASAFWANVRLLGGITVGLAFARGRADLEKLSVSPLTLTNPASITIGKEAEDNRSTVELQKSKVLQSSIDYRSDKLFLSLDYKRFDFDFLKPVFKNSNAIVDVGALNVSYSRNAWNMDWSIVYTHQDYNNTPRSFNYFSPLSNYWLDYADQLTVENMLGFEMHAFTLLQISIYKGHSGRRGLEAGDQQPLLSFNGGGMMGADGAGTKYAYARGRYETYIQKNLYIQADARIPYYWDAQSARGYVDPYIEFGYRNRQVELSIGLGLDPVAFDPVRNDYFDIGRLEYLRDGSWAIISKCSSNTSCQASGSSTGVDLKENLLQNERSLRERTRLKIEWIVLF